MNVCAVYLQGSGMTAAGLQGFLRCLLLLLLEIASTEKISACHPKLTHVGDMRDWGGT